MNHAPLYAVPGMEWRISPVSKIPYLSQICEKKGSSPQSFRHFLAFLFEKRAKVLGDVCVNRETLVSWFYPLSKPISQIWKYAQNAEKLLTTFSFISAIRPVRFVCRGEIWCRCVGRKDMLQMREMELETTVNIFEDFTQKTHPQKPVVPNRVTISIITANEKKELDLWHREHK